MGLLGPDQGWLGTPDYALYTVFAVLSVFFVLRWVRETKGVELEEMHGDTSAVRGDAGRSG